MGLIGKRILIGLLTGIGGATALSMTATIAAADGGGGLGSNTFAAFLFLSSLFLIFLLGYAIRDAIQKRGQRRKPMPKTAPKPVPKPAPVERRL